MNNYDKNLELDKKILERQNSLVEQHVKSQREGQRLISVYIPMRFDDLKRKSGMTWRAVIAKAFNYGHKVEELQEEVEHWISSLEKKNHQLRELQRKYYMYQDKYGDLTECLEEKEEEIKN